MKRPTLFGTLVLMAFLVLAGPAWSQAGSEFFRGEVAPRPAPDTQPEALREVGFDQLMGEVVPLDLPFRDAEGREVRLGDFFGQRPVLLSLVYHSCPMLCPMTLGGLAGSLKALPFDIGEGYEVVVVSFNPEEGPELAAQAKEKAVRHYGRAGTEDGWHFLTGDAEAIAELTAAVGFRYTWDEEAGQYAHGAGIVALTSDGTIARYFFGIEVPPKDLKLGLVEAGEGRIGSAVDQILLYCYHYDPDTGEYALSGWVFLALKIAAAITLLALAGFVALMLWQERKRLRRLPERPPDRLSERDHESRTASHA